MWRLIRWLPESIFIVSFFLVSVSKAQTVPPDTVIIERIKVEKREIYIHEIDTLVQVDTVVEIQKDTVFIEQKKQNLLPSWQGKPLFMFGGQFGLSHDRQHTQFWQTQEDYYNKTIQSLSSSPNLHGQVFFNMIHKRMNYKIGLEWMALRDQFRNTEFTRINSLQYLSFEPQIGYSLLKKTRLELLVWGRAGVKQMIRQKGSYLKISNLEEVTTNVNEFPTRKTLFSVGAGISTRWSLTNKWMVETSLYTDYWPSSITQTQHPVLYWKTLFGFQFGFSMLL